MFTHKNLFKYSLAGFIALGSMGVGSTILAQTEKVPTVYYCAGQVATIIGTPYNDNPLTGTAGNDVIVGLDGNDIITGLGGNDIICGGNGNDALYGQAGDDKLYGEAGADSDYGDIGNDFIQEDDSTSLNTLRGDDGNDTLIGSNFALTSGTEIFVGGAGFDTINTRDGVSYVEGGTEADTITGGNQTDTIYGGNGLDTIHGGGGVDYIYGDAGADVLYGDAGSPDYCKGGLDGPGGADYLDSSCETRIQD